MRKNKDRMVLLPVLGRVSIQMSTGEFCEQCSSIVMGHNSEDMDANDLNESRQDDIEMQKTANDPI